MINSRSTQIENEEKEKFLLPTINTFPGLLSRPSCAPLLPQQYGSRSVLQPPARDSRARLRQRKGEGKEEKAIHHIISKKKSNSLIFWRKIYKILSIPYQSAHLSRNTFPPTEGWLARKKRKSMY